MVPVCANHATSAAASWTNAGHISCTDRRTTGCSCGSKSMQWDEEVGRTGQTVINQAKQNDKKSRKNVAYHKTAHRQLRQRWRIEVQHCWVRVILNFAEHLVPRLCPQIVYIVERFIETLDGDPFDHDSFEYECHTQHTSQICVHNGIGGVWSPNLDRHIAEIAIDVAENVVDGSAHKESSTLYSTHLVRFQMTYCGATLCDDVIGLRRLFEFVKYDRFRAFVLSTCMASWL